MKDGVDVLNERIRELEAIVVQQRDGFFEQQAEIQALKAENKLLRKLLDAARGE